MRRVFSHNTFYPSKLVTRGTVNGVVQNKGANIVIDLTLVLTV